MASSEPTPTSSTQKRARQQLSCITCRNGKLKCDRQQPCDQCIKRSRDSSCQYLAPPAKKKQNRNTKERVAHLEGLVVQLMSKDGSATPDNPRKETRGASGSPDGGYTTANDPESRSGSRPSPTSGLESLPDVSDIGFGQLKISHGQTEYKGASHWESILESIADVKAAIGDGEDSEEDDEEEDEGLLPISTLGLLGSSTVVTRNHLLQHVPAKPVADRLLWQWFNSTDPALPVIHRPTFLAEYERFWREPSETSTMWLALFFAMLCLGSRITQMFSQVDQTIPQSAGINSADQFQNLAASALQFAGFMKPKKYTVEAMLMYVSCEHLRKADDEIKLWYIMSIIARVALRMGYHRDPEHFPRITPFEGEMRRRVWSVVYIFDVLLSQNQGLPNMLQHLQIDTKTPRNLLDTDFGPDSTELPPARAPAELSPVSYSITKYKMTSVLARAYSMAHSVQTPNYDKIMEIDRFVQKTASEQPAALRFTSSGSDVFDSPSLLFHRYKGELTLHKTRCVLHRPFLSAKFVGTRMEISRKLCVEAALSMIKHHEYVFRAAQDGGQLGPVRMYIASLSAHDFLLAAMVLCVELDLISSATSPAMAGPNQEKIGEMRGYIQKSYNIYKQPGNRYAQTNKALKAMEIILNKSKGANAPRENSQHEPILDPFSTAFDSEQPLSTTSTLDTSLSYSNSNDQTEANTNYDALLNPGQDMDWQTWDTIIQNRDGMNNMTWPPGTDTDLQFLGTFVDEGMDANLLGINNLVDPPRPDTGTNVYPPVDDTTPFWP